MTTKYFCDRCNVEVVNLIWFVEICQFDVHGKRMSICESCKISFGDWLGYYKRDGNFRKGRSDK